MRAAIVLSCLVYVAVVTPRAHAQPGWVLSHQKISDTEGGFSGTLSDPDWFDISMGESNFLSFASLIVIVAVGDSALATEPVHAFRR